MSGRRGLLVVAGEASGDLHASRVVSALLERRNDLEIFGLGGAALRESGMEAIADSGEISVVGITEALSILRRAKEIFDAILVEVERRRPAAALLVDFPEFNLRLAKELAWRGVPVVYFVSPQIWAWRRGRVRTIRETVARMLVLFDFEADFYQRNGVPVAHVGHPLVDEVPSLPQAWDRVGTGKVPVTARVALLPGSRPSEVEALLPIQLGAIRGLARGRPVDAFVVRAPSIDEERVRRIMSVAGVDLPIVGEHRFSAIAGAHVALCASGTATLETGLLGTPLIVLYRLSTWTWRLARMLVRVPHASLVNLVLRRAVVPELLQGDAVPERATVELERLLSSRAAVDRMREELAALRDRLGAPGAAERAATEVLDLIDRGARAA